VIKYKYIILIIFASLLSITSCEKAEVPIKLPPRGNTTFVSITLGKEFEKQAFYNLKDSQITLVDNNSWDLAFEAAPFGNKITLNGGTDMYAARTNSKTFFNTNKPDTFNYKWDAPCGCFDSLAIRTEPPFNTYVYIIDRGYLYTTDRYFQIKLLSISNSQYYFEYASLTNPSVITKKLIDKNPNKLNVYFSFSTPNTYLDFEPNRDDWDFCFVKYRFVFFETAPITKYVVKGIFINTSKIVAAVDSTQKFEAITPSFAENKCKYSGLRDAMGYDWKVYNFTTGQYNSRTYVNYMIKDKRSDAIYKLRFLDFNDNGIKGTPKFEYVLLK
jgi:hypothetical protein